jgi:hypothetical protein
VQLWDSEEIFKNNSPLARDGLCLKSVFFDITAAMNAPKQSPFSNTATLSTASQLNNTDDISMFFGSNVPFQNTATVAPTNTSTRVAETSPSGEKEVFIPPLVSVVLNLLHATQVESSNIVSVCLESLFKIALWCPLESPLRQLISEEFYEISASSFGINFPFLDNHHQSPSHTATVPSHGPNFDFYQSPYSVDPRSVLSTLDRLGLGDTVETPFSSSDSKAMLNSSSSSSICQFSAMRFGNEWHESSVCRESNLYSLALESLEVAKDPPQFRTTVGENDSNLQTFDPPKDLITAASSGGLFGMDFLGDPIPLPQSQSSLLSLSHQNSHQSESDLLSSAGATEREQTAASAFVVDGIELKKLFYQLDQKALFNF